MDSLRSSVEEPAIYLRWATNESSEPPRVSLVTNSHVDQPPQLMVNNAVKIESCDFRDRTWQKEHSSGRLMSILWINMEKRSSRLTLDVRQTDLNAIIDSFDIREAADYTLTCFGGCATFPSASSDDDFQGAAFVPHLISMLWRHRTATAQNHVVCWGDQWVLKVTQALLQDLKHLASSPMFPALLAAAMLGRRIDLELQHLSDRISEVELRTRCHPFGPSTTPQAQGSFHRLSTNMSGCSTHLAGLERIETIIRNIVARVKEYELREYLKPKPCYSQFQRMTNLLNERLEIERAQIKFLSRRTEVRLIAVKPNLSTLSLPLPFSLLPLSHKV